MKKAIYWILPLLLLAACAKMDETPSPAPEPLYFPPAGSAAWETVSAASLGWNEAELSNLYTFLQGKGTKAFLVLKNGRLVTERYFGSFTADSLWYWASAGKTLTAFLVGLAQQEGKLNINHPTAHYLGAGWTALPPAKEAAITIRHQLTMTTGLDDGVADVDCTLPACLQYKGDAGIRWAYHNAPYTLLEKVVEKAAGTSYNLYFQQVLRNRIGMNGAWIKMDFNNVYFSNARSMARFGLLLLNRGVWNGTAILKDTSYFTSQVSSSQALNPAYGYLTWLNGKGSYRLPQTQLSLNGPLIPNAPPDTYAALGKNDQKLYVVPSQNLVVVRMGESAGSGHLAASSFDNELWGKLKQVFRL